MADVPGDENTDDEPQGKEANEARGTMKQTILTAALVFVAALAAQVVSPPLLRRLYPDSAPPAPPAATAATTATTAQQGPAQAAGAAPAPQASAAEADLAPAIYTPLDPPLLANFSEDDGTTHYLQLGLEAMARDQDSIDAIKQHAPALRNAFLLLLSGESYKDIATREGKEQLRATMLEQAQKILRRNTGKPGVEELYFTSFVVQ